MGKNWKKRLKIFLFVVSALLMTEEAVILSAGEMVATSSNAEQKPGPEEPDEEESENVKKETERAFLSEKGCSHGKKGTIKNGICEKCNKFGYCGDINGDSTPDDNLIWELTEEENGTYTLEISGSGKMFCYNYKYANSSVKTKDAPWTWKTETGEKPEIKTIILPEGLTNIGTYSFYMTAAEEVKIPETVTEIGDQAFYGCTKLKQIDIPDAVTRIGEKAFTGCVALKTVSISTQSKLKKIEGSAFYYCIKLEEFYIPEGIIEVLPYTFAQCRKLQTIHLPEKLEKIGDSAFQSCNALRELNFPDGLKEIGERAFSVCDTLTELKFPASISKIGKEAFYGCSELQNIYFMMTEEEYRSKQFNEDIFAFVSTVPKTLKTQGKKEAVCTLDGYSTEHLSNGNGLFYDKNKTELSYDEVVIPAVNHTDRDKNGVCDICQNPYLSFSAGKSARTIERVLLIEENPAYGMEWTDVIRKNPDIEITAKIEKIVESDESGDTAGENTGIWKENSNENNEKTDRDQEKFTLKLPEGVVTEEEKDWEFVYNGEIGDYEFQNVVVLKGKIKAELPEPEEPEPEDPEPEDPEPEDPEPEDPEPEEPKPEQPPVTVPSPTPEPTPEPDPEPDRPEPDKPEPDKPEPDKPDKPEPDKPEPDKPEPEEPEPDKPELEQPPVTAPSPTPEPKPEPDLEPDKQEPENPKPEQPPVIVPSPTPEPEPELPKPEQPEAPKPEQPTPPSSSGNDSPNRTSKPDRNTSSSAGKWFKDEKGWRYLNTDGIYLSGNGEEFLWKYINGTWWIFGSDGYLKIGWIFDSKEDCWYYQYEDTGVKTGWHQNDADGYYYYLEPSSKKMLLGWQWIDGEYYYLNPVSDGQTWFYNEQSGMWEYDSEKKNKPLGGMYQNERTPDGYFVKKDGTWDGKSK